MQCCSKWLLQHPAVIEAMDAHYWTEGGNLAAVFSPDSMPCAMRGAIKDFDAGLKKSLHEKAKRNAKYKEVQRANGNRR